MHTFRPLLLQIVLMAGSGRSMPLPLHQPPLDVLLGGVGRKDGMPLPENPDRGPVILTSCATMTALGILTIIARIYTRAWMTNSTDLDDHTMWVAMVC